MPSFEIPDIPPKAQLKQETENNQTVSTGAVTFTVTNKTGQGLSGRVTVEQFNPAGRLEFDASAIKQILRVIPERELRGE